MTKDANDIARESGPAALRAAIDGATMKPRRKSKAITKSENDPDLSEMNEKYAVVLVCGKTRIVYFDDEGGRKLPVFQTLPDFKAFHANRRKSLPNSRGGTTELGMGEWWISNPERRQYETIGYYPNEDNPQRLNLWNGFSCEPKKGDCSLYLKHIEQNICAGVAEYYNYTINWMAHCVQYPGIQPGTAIVLKGKEGVGKGVFVTILDDRFLGLNHITRHRRACRTKCGRRDGD